MSVYTIISTSGKTVVVYSTLEQLEQAHKDLLDRKEELDEKVRALLRERDELKRQVATYVKEEQP